MPIVTVHAFAPSDPASIPKMLAEIQASGAAALNCAPDNLWALFEEIPRGRYLQSDNPERNPPIVTIQANVGRTLDQRTALAKGISRAVVGAFGIPAARVWIHYQEMQPHDVWFNEAWASS
jgi:phenylpyruvate tautomerase PptA (4-oxalocrotonate tautomerase family)